MEERRSLRPVLTCTLKNVVLVSYRVPENLLLPHVPRGCDLDTPADEPDLHLISVVALTFADTRFFGLPVPTLQGFPQVNLRFYVRQGSRQGVVFLRELVTPPLIAMGGRLLYAQPFDLATLSVYTSTLPPGSPPPRAPGRVLHVRAPRWVNRLSADLNSLPPLTRLPHCPVGNGSHDVVTFGYADGDRWTVHIYGCGDIDAGEIFWPGLIPPSLAGDLDRLAKSTECTQAARIPLRETRKGAG